MKKIIYLASLLLFSIFTGCKSVELELFTLYHYNSKKNYEQEWVDSTSYYEQQCTVNLLVSDSLTLKPISDVLALFIKDSISVFWGVTDSLGFLNIKMTTGAYLLRLEADYYLNKSDSVILSQSDSVLRVQITMNPDCQIVGRLISSKTATPIANTLIYLSSQNEAEDITITSTDGYFKFDKLKPDTYNIYIIEKDSENEILLETVFLSLTNRIINLKLSY